MIAPAPPARRGPAERLTRDTAAERSPASPLRCRVTPRLRRLTRFARARHTETEAAGLALIHIRHRNLEFLRTARSSARSARSQRRCASWPGAPPLSPSELRSGWGHDGAPGKIRYLRWVTPGASTARTCSSRTSASPRLSRRREPPPSNTGTTCSSSSSSSPAARYCWTT